MEDELYNQGREADQAFEKKEEDIAPWDEETHVRSKPGIISEPEYQEDEEEGPADLDPRMK